MKKLSVLLFLIVFAGCAGTQKKLDDEKFDAASYFPIEDGCSWIYLVGKGGAKKTQYIVKVVSKMENGGMIAWGAKTYSYIYKKDGVYNTVEDSYILKNPALKKWDLRNGKAEIVESHDFSGNVIAVKETYPQKGFYTVSHYKKYKGLIRFEVYSLKGDNGSLIEKMELGEHLCSDID